MLKIVSKFPNLAVHRSRDGDLNNHMGRTLATFWRRTANPGEGQYCVIGWLMRVGMIISLEI
jgi:hypothetical protein